MSNRTGQIIAASVAITASLGILGWFVWCVVAREVLMLAVGIGAIGFLFTLFYPTLILVRYVPRLVRAIRSPRA